MQMYTGHITDSLQHLTAVKSVSSLSLALLFSLQLASHVRDDVTPDWSISIPLCIIWNSIPIIDKSYQ